MSLDVMMDNEGAQQLYRRLGDEVTGTFTDLGFTKRSGIPEMMRMVKSIT
jgi:ribosomal protein S18 acetylase RimI-like enzyme